MTRSLSPRSSLATLKREAKRWLAALRDDDPDARDRLRTTWPHAPAAPTLRDVQHALAREYGHPDWKALSVAVQAIADAERAASLDRADQLALVLQHGWNGHAAIARRLVAREPALRTANVFAAAACGEVDLVADLIARDPSLVHAVDDVRGWTALAHVAYGRLDDTHAVRLATLLLDAGADVAFAFDDGWGNPFTLITGAIGQGEGVKPTHPQADALVELFLARGADPYDTQALYNTSIVGDDITWMNRLWRACEVRGTTERWTTTHERALGGHRGLDTLTFLLGNAITFAHPQRAAWTLARGAHPNAVHAYSGRALHTEAVLLGHTELADLLVAHGATPVTLGARDALIAAVMRGDIDDVRRRLAVEPSLLVSSGALASAARAGRADMVTLLLTLGADPHRPDHDGANALHRAVQGGHEPAVQALLAAGADVNRRDGRYQSTALGWANVLGRPALADVLAERSTDVRELARAAQIERLDVVLDDAPTLAREVRPDPRAPTALFCLPDDDEDAVEVVALLLASGADPSVRNASGLDAAGAARLRGLDAAAAVLEGGGT